MSMLFFKPKIWECSNGSIIQWFSKETVKYSNNLFAVEVWVDYHHEIKGEGRVIYKSEIKKWVDKPKDAEANITDEQKEEIVKCIVEFLTDNGVKDILIV